MDMPISPTSSNGKVRVFVLLWLIANFPLSPRCCGAGRFGGALALAPDTENRMTRGEDLYSQTKYPKYLKRAVVFDGYDDYLVFTPDGQRPPGQQRLEALGSEMTLIVAFSTNGGAGGRDGRGGWVLSTNNLFAPAPKGPVGFGP